MGNRTVGDPHLGPIEQVRLLTFFCASRHPRWIRTKIGFRESEASNRLSASHLRQPSLLLFFRSKGKDGIHDQRILNGKHCPQTAITPAQFLADQPVDGMTHLLTAISIHVETEEP